MEDLYDIDRIQAYLSGQMSREERISFEKAMKKDDSLKEEVEFTRDLQFVLDEEERLSVKVITDQILEEFSTKNDPGDASSDSPTSSGATGVSLKNIWLWLLLLAASGAALLWWQPWNAKEQRLQQIADDYLTPIENVLSTDARLGDLHLGMMAYENGDYERAAVLLDKQLEKAPDNNVRLYQAISLVLSGKAAEAIPILETLEGRDFVGHKKAATWYLALSYLQIGKEAEALTKLEALRSSPIYQDRVSAIFLKIKGADQ